MGDDVITADDLAGMFERMRDKPVPTLDQMRTPPDVVTCVACAKAALRGADGWLCQAAVYVGDSIDYWTRTATEADVQPESWVCSTACAWATVGGDPQTMRRL
jgi:hypothetical protein